MTELNTAELRRSALTLAGGIAGVFGLILPLLFHRSLPAWPWMLATVLVASALLCPERLRPIFRWWMAFAHVLGRVNSVVLLSVVFIAVVSPIGMILRLFGYDPLCGKRSDSVSSYRKSSAVPCREQMEKPY